MGIKDTLLKMLGKEEKELENNLKTYTAKAGTLEKAVSKGMSSKAKLALATILAAGAIGLSGFAPSDAHAAGGEINADVYSQSQQYVDRAGTKVLQVQQARIDPLGIRLDNPDSQYFDKDFDPDEIPSGGSNNYERIDERWNSTVSPNTRINEINGDER